MRRLVVALGFWLTVSFALNVAILFLVQFPYNLILCFVSIMAINVYVWKRVIPKVMPKGGLSIFRDDYRTLGFACVTCGFRHRMTACPKCNSRLKRLD